MLHRVSIGYRADARLGGGGHIPMCRKFPIGSWTARKCSRTERKPVTARVIRIRTDDWPERDRAAMFREMHGRDAIRVQPARGEPLRIDATLIKLSNLGVLFGSRSPLQSEFADDSDRLMLSLGGPAVARQFGREVLLEQGDAIALSGADRGTLTTLRTGRIVTLDFPQGCLLPMVKSPRQTLARRIPKHSLPLRLLRGYRRAA